jgi:hypothetical protein
MQQRYNLAEDRRPKSNDISFATGWAEEVPDTAGLAVVAEWMSRR